MNSQMVGFLFLTIAVFYANSAATNDFISKVKASKEKCAAEHNVDIAVFKQLWKEHKLPETDNGKCFLACIMKDMGVYADGKFDVDVLQSYVPQKWTDEESIEKAMKINTDCVEEVKTEGKDECALALELVTCFVRESEKVGLKAPGHKEEEETR